MKAIIELDEISQQVGKKRIGNEDREEFQASVKILSIGQYRYNPGYQIGKKEKLLFDKSDQVFDCPRIYPP